MAVLGATTLTDCFYIEQFLGGTDPLTGQPYRCVFNSTNPSVSWTKETSLVYNNAALRVTTGDGYVTGGSAAFTTVLSSGKSIGLSVQSATATVTLNPASANVGSNQSQAAPGVPAVITISTVADLPMHTHTFRRNVSETVLIGNPSSPKLDGFLSVTDRNSSQRGDSQGHLHTITLSALHSHGVTGTHTHTVSGGSHGHTPPTSGTQEDFAVLYRDVVIARKDVKP